MKIPAITFLKRSPAVAVGVGAVVLALGGWAVADGQLGSATGTATTTTTAASPGASTDNVAVATNTKDGKTVVALAIKITQTDSPTVDAANAAVAVASCEDCQTVAIALEAVLVVGQPENFSPTNLALAVNTGCTNCETLAAAYQKVVQNDTRVRVTGAGRREIAAIRTDLLSLRQADLDIAAVQQKVNEAAARFTAVLENEVVPIGPPPGTGRDAPAETTTTAASSPTTTTAGTTPESTTTTSSPPTTAAT